MELQRRKVRHAAARGGVSVAGVAEVIQTRVPAKLLNNAAVLYMRVGRPHKALELLEEALEVRAEVFMLPCQSICRITKCRSFDTLPFGATCQREQAGFQADSVCQQAALACFRLVCKSVSWRDVTASMLRRARMSWKRRSR